MYQPHVVAMQADQKLEVTIEDTFTREEIAIPVKCNVHPWMKSYAAVFKHPFFAITGKDGSFELNGLPPGTYTLKVWHEKLGTATQPVAVRGSETKTVQFVLKANSGS